MSEVLKAVSHSCETPQNNSSKNIRLKWYRRLIQTLVLTGIGQWSLYGILRCPFIVPYVSCQSCPVLTCHGRLFTVFWSFWLMLALSVIFFGRAFCGWACPGGLVNRLLGRISLVKIRDQHLIPIVTYGKYFGLALVLFIWLVWGQPREAIPIRVGDFFTSVKLTFAHANLLWLTRTCFVFGFVTFGVVLANMWCRFVCPTGGGLEILKSIAFFGIYKKDVCNDCNKCLTVCNMKTRPSEANCTNCGDCISACPRHAIQIGRLPK